MAKKTTTVSNSLEDLLKKDGKKIEKNDKFSLNLEKNDPTTQTSPNLSNYTANEGQRECPPPITQIKITRKAFTDLILMSRAANYMSERRWGVNSPKMEIFCYVLCDDINYNESAPEPITEIYIPQHTATETSVEVSSENILEVQKYIKKHKKRILGWAHSHGHFEVYSSKIDDQNHQTLLMDTSNILFLNNYHLKYIYGITVNDQGDRFGVVLTQYPCGHTQREEDQEFILIGKKYAKDEEKARYREILQIVAQRVLFVEPHHAPSSEDIEMDLTEELMDQFIKKIRKAKRMLFNSIPDVDNETFSAIQDSLKQYDELLIDGVEESFHQVSNRLYKVVQAKKDAI